MMFKVGLTTENWAKKSSIPCAYSETSTSTNLVAKNKKISESAIISLYVTEHQSEGRGRAEHTWTDLPGQMLLSSWVFEMNSSPQPVLAASIGLAVYRALKTTWPWLHWSLKAPNDIFLNTKKVAGLLIENLQEGSRNRLIIGLGINLFGHPDLETATSLFADLGKDSASTLTVKEWEEALDRLLLELSLAVSLTTATLSQSQCLALKHALNAHPNSNNLYQQVEPDGSLVSDNKKVHWSEL